MNGWMHDRLVGIATESLEFQVNMNTVRDVILLGLLSLFCFFNFSMFYSKSSSTEVTKPISL